MAEAIGALAVRIGADATELVSGFKKAEKATDQLAGALKIATGAVLAAGTAIAVMVKHAVDGADALNKQAQAAGMATGAFSEYAYVAKLANISNEALGTSLSRLNRNMVEAATGTGEAKDAFKALGIDVRNADGSLKSADQVIEAVAQEFAGMEDGAGKSALAMMLFGKAGAAMVPMLNAGAIGIREMREEARQLGVTIDSETGKAAERFNDNLTRLGQVQQGLANRLMAELLPAMNAVTDHMVKSAKETGGFHDEIRALANLIQGTALTVFQTLAVVGSDIAFTFKMIGGEIGVWGAQLAALARLDFAGFRLIGEEWTRDAEQARRDLDAFQARVMQLKAIGPVLDAGGATDTGGSGDINRKKPAPELPDESAAKAAAAKEQEIRDALHKVRVEDDRRAIEQVALTNKERERMDAEAMAARLAAIDYENDEAIRKGQELLDAERAAAEEKRRIDQMQLQASSNFQNDMASLMNTSSRRTFEIGKAAAIAQAVVKGHAAVISAYEAGMSTSGPWAPYVAVAYAAAAAAATANMINNISKQSFGGGRGAPTPVGQGPSGVGAVPSAASAPGGGRSGRPRGDQACATRPGLHRARADGRADHALGARGHPARGPRGFRRGAYNRLRARGRGGPGTRGSRLDAASLGRLDSAGLGSGDCGFEGSLIV